MCVCLCECGHERRNGMKCGVCVFFFFFQCESDIVSVYVLFWFLSVNCKFSFSSVSDFFQRNCSFLVRCRRLTCLVMWRIGAGVWFCAWFRVFCVFFFCVSVWFYQVSYCLFELLTAKLHFECSNLVRFEILRRRQCCCSDFHEEFVLKANNRLIHGRVALMQIAMKQKKMLKTVKTDTVS